MQYNSITCRGARPPKEASYHYQRLAESYKEWLSLIGYAQDTVNHLPSQLQYFFLHLEKQQINSLEKVCKKNISCYYESIKQRKNPQTGSFLKSSTLNGYLRNLRLFSHYLEETGQGSLPIDIRNEPKEQAEREVLTREEIKQLYHACSEQTAGLRERAILSLYYGCGLRSSEGLRLNVEDILLEKQLLYVRKSKNYKARYVPFIKSQQQDFILYLKHCRPALDKADTIKQATPAFLLNNKGERMRYGQLSGILKSLIERTADEALQERKIGLHTLRHSIATHLLQSGMEIEAIAQLLGHRQIRSTQTYLHLLHEYA